jgi:hypothetical protein
VELSLKDYGALLNHTNCLECMKACARANPAALADHIFVCFLHFFVKSEQNKHNQQQNNRTIEYSVDIDHEGK